MKKLTYDYVKQLFTDRGYELLESEYVGCETKMRYRCPRHPEHDTSITYKDLKKGAGCYYCGIEARTQKNRPDFKDVSDEFCKRGYLLIETEYKNSKTPMKFVCPKHLDKFTEISYGSLLRGSGCIYCAGLGKPTTMEVDKKFDDRGYTLLTPYKNSSSKLEYICSKHPSKILSITHNNFSSGQGCTYCAGISRYTLNDAKKLFSEAGYELLDDVYADSHTPMRYKCPNHPDKETRVSLKQLNKGTRCRYCYLDNNKGEKHPRYNPDLSDEYREYKRADIGYNDWRRKVFERDSYACTSCGDSKGGNLVAHHKDGYGWCKERRTDVNNGVTLCEDCHKQFHSLYGFRNNTESQYREWLKAKEASE
jgi:hypothetical protein